MATDNPKTDWQVSHTEGQGRTTVVCNFNDDMDDPGELSIFVKGRGHDVFAAKLAALLQEHQVPSK